MKKHETLQPADVERPRRHLRDVHAKRLNQFAILDAGRARRFARPAVEAQVEMVMNLVIQLQAAVGNGAHEVDAAARAIRFEAKLEVCRASRGAQAAMHAIQEQLIVDAGLLRLGGVHRRQRRSTWFSGDAHVARFR